MELTESLKELLIETARKLKGRDRRRFMALTVRELGPGGQRLAERELGWSRVTIRKGLRELEAGASDPSLPGPQGRQRAEERLPQLLADICALIEQQRRLDPDPKCSTDPRMACLSAAEVRRRLISDFGYTDDELPTVQTIAAKLKTLGYHPRRAPHPQAPMESPRGATTQKIIYPSRSSSEGVEA
ncbi:MAG: hypothetical protein RMK84_12795 [Oscillochloridaceae bacterium]|nr:hypothetical protein [Chloroflexaceae bacterium]MDW8390997.1 hypothetical protein [Oscillochloridaceae bacterium]